MRPEAPMKILLRLMNHLIFGAIHAGNCLSSITQTSSGIFCRFLGLVYLIRDMARRLEPTASCSERAPTPGYFVILHCNSKQTLADAHS